MLTTPEEQLILNEYLRRKQLRAKGKTFLDYIQQVAPFIVIEEFHILVAEHFERLARGEISRLMVFAPPRAGKSLLTSELLPGWWMGNFPTDQILHTSYATSLVEGFGRSIRNTIGSNEAYAEMFPACRLASDSKSATRWGTTKDGKYAAAGVGTGIAGKGFNLGLCDDPISEQDAFSRTLRHNVNNWYGPGFYTRRMPNRNAIVLTQTRWAPDDLSGFLLANALTNPDADEWTVVRISAEIDAEMAQELNRIAQDPKYEKYLNPPDSIHPYPMTYSEKDSFSPRRWPLKELLRSRGNMTRRNWNALYQQSPTEDEGAIFLREYWRKWTGAKIPKFEYILQSYDTAFDEGEHNDYSVRFTFGVFRRESDGRHCVFLLERWKDRVTFPDLRDESYDANKKYKPDRIIIEKAASGHPLYQELKRAGLPVSAIPPKGSKRSRANAATIMLEQGCVYYPADRRWAEEVIDTLASFTGQGDAYDDEADAFSQGLMFLRRMFWVDAPSDDEDDDSTEGATLSEFDTPRRSYAHVHGNYGKGAV